MEKKLRIKIIIRFIMIVLLSSHALIVSGQLSTELEKISFPTPGEISIVASTPIPDGVVPTSQSYDDLIECGFNMGMTNGSLEYFKQQFALIGNRKFKYLIQNNALYNEKRVDFIQAFANEPNFGGWKFKDEPKFEELEDLKIQYDILFNAAPHQLIYINLAGVTSKYFSGSITSYYDYLMYIDKLIHPEIWSFDFYPILEKNGKLIVEYDNFYNALESCCDMSIKSGRPFWSYCETMAYKTTSYCRPPITTEYLRFEAFSSLAYGAQGLVYWTYGQRKSNDKEIYLSALVNLDNKKTQAWYIAQKVNSEIKKYNYIFYKCQVLKVRHTGDKIYKGTKKLSGDFGPFKMIRSGAAGVMVSYIENNGEKYIVLVNRDVEHAQKTHLELIANKTIEDITSKNHKIYTWRKDINVNIDKGGYKIFKEL